MDILIKSCNLISMSEKREKYEENIDIYISNGKIKEIGKNLAKSENVQIINAKGKICMPGLINLHTHLSMSIFRETLDGYTLQDWLTQKIWPMEDKLTNEDIYYASLLSCIEMVSTGTTLANDQYFMAEDTIKAACDIGMRVQVTRTINDVAELGDLRLKELEELIREYNHKYDNITLNVGIHGLYTTKEYTLQEAIKIAKQKNLPIHMHFCENAKETEEIKQEYNVKSPVDVIEKYFTQTNTILAHAVKLTDEEIKKLSKLNVSIAHCPVSNLRLGCGIAKIQKMNENGINIGLGTDGQGSGSNLDLFESMKFAGLLQKGEFENPKNMESYDILKMATVNGAKALGLEGILGKIEEEMRADLILIDLNTETTMPKRKYFL